MDATIADPLLGALVDGRYRVRARAARGGMATVYTATDERLERTVALKVIRPAHAGDPNFVERFTSEAKAIARLTHPNVVAVYDQGRFQDLPYLVMEYVRGRTLRELLAERGRLAPQDALAVLDQMLAAIAAAHRAGLVHRDVKPENVLVAEAPGGGADTSLVDGVVKVADFGLARAVEASAESGGSHLMATAAYVAPELLTKSQADPRADVYSAGIVLFEMLTGRVPYEGDRPADVAWQHVEHDVPPPSRYVPGLPPILDDLVARATRRDPGGRPADAGAMLAEVQAAREDAGVALAGRKQPLAAPTVIVPRVQSAPPAMQYAPAADATAITPLGPGPASNDRPSWARLASARRQQAKPGQPGRARRRAGRSQPVGQALSGLTARVNADPRTRVAGLAGLVVLCLLVVVGAWWLGIARYTTAPSLMNKTKVDAIAEAQQRGFTVKLAEARFDENAAKDTVLKQDPGPGDRILSGGTITLTLSKGPERSIVPDIIGKPYNLASEDLKRVNLVPKQGQRFDDNIPEGSVVQTDPGVGTELQPGSTVTVWVSKGRAPLTVPLVVGKPLEEARRILEEMGLQVEVQNQDSDQPKDQVLAQDPSDGAGVEPNAKVTLTVSNGPAAVQLPDVRNMNVDQAKQTLEGLGLRVLVIGAGTVRFQDPQPGTQVEPGRQVTIMAVG